MDRSVTLKSNSHAYSERGIPSAEKYSDEQRWKCAIVHNALHMGMFLADQWCWWCEDEFLLCRHNSEWYVVSLAKVTSIRNVFWYFFVWVPMDELVMRCLFTYVLCMTIKVRGLYSSTHWATVELPAFQSNQTMPLTGKSIKEKVVCRFCLEHSVWLCHIWFTAKQNTAGKVRWSFITKFPLYLVLQ